MADKDAYEEKLNKLRQEYREVLPHRLLEIDSAWEQVLQDGSKDKVEKLYGLIHGLAGSGATFGYTRLSGAAKDLEALIHGLTESDAAIAALKPRVDKLIEALKEAATQPDHLEHSDHIVANPPKTFTGKEQLVCWLGDDDQLANRFRDQLTNFRMAVKRVDSFNELRAMLADEPSVIIIDRLDGDDDNVADLSERLASLETEAPILCITNPDETMESWIQLVRAGASASAPKPVNFYEFLEKLDALTYVEKEAPYRLLIIDDDKILANHTAAILNKAGMQVRVVTDPAKTMRPLEKFHPDLILMDLYMPKCSGLELAKIIRQDNRYLTTPIVYLSRETQVNKKLAALEMGADDFLFKPVKYRYLYHALSARIKRARQLKAYMTRDGLTGLLNHSNLRERLNQEMARAVESNRPLTYALLDLDDFRAVNSAYGYPAGDCILKSFAILLKRHLGHRAHIGRLGGVEFGVALPRTTQEVAERILNQVRVCFSQVAHEFGGSSFHLTLSGGLAAYPGFETTEHLAKSAAQALLQAKSMGRNQLLAIDPETTSNQGRGASRQTAVEDEADFDDILLLDDAVDADELAADEEGSPDEIPPPPTGGPKIVVVDDDRQVLSHIAAVLRENGYDPCLAETGDEGFDLVKKHRPKVALVDLLLFPGIHGFELCQRIREDPDLQDVRIILMTAVYKDYRYRLEGKEAGADEFVEKPLDFYSLLQKIKRLSDA